MESADSRKDLERVFEVPARVLEESVDAAAQGEKALMSKKPFKLAEEYWNTLGPGLTTGAADDDPSGIATYSQAGAQYGPQLIWLALFTFPFMATVQEMCARIGLVTGRGLAANIRRHYPAGALYAVAGLLFLANAFNIAADLNAMAAATRLLTTTASPIALIALFAFVSLILQVFTTYARYAKFLKYLALALLSYVVVAFSVGLDWSDILRHTVVPHLEFSRGQLFLLCAILGTTISPYLFFWQTSQEVEEERLRGKGTRLRHEVPAPAVLRKMRTDVWSGMLFSNLITFFIFAACAGTLYSHGVTDIVSAASAARALEPFGNSAYLLFTLGIVGTGLLAVPVLAGSSAYAFAESFGWTSGLDRKLKQAHAFYGVIIMSLLAGVAANLLHVDPIKGLIYAAVGNGIVAPIVLFFIVRMSANRRIMGEHANSRSATMIGWVTVAFMALSGAAALASFF